MKSRICFDAEFELYKILENFKPSYLSSKSTKAINSEHRDYQK